MSLTAIERETMINMNDEEPTAFIWTAQRPIITKLKKNPSAILVEEGNHGGTIWARFEIPKQFISLRQARVKRTLTDEDRQALVGRAEHMRKHRR